MVGAISKKRGTHSYGCGAYGRAACHLNLFSLLTFFIADITEFTERIP
jgi:hypothetical protein